MSACWTRVGRPAPEPPVHEPPVHEPPAPDPVREPPDASPQSEACDHCGSGDTWWRNCKLLCRGCGSIVKSCADL